MYNPNKSEGVPGGQSPQGPEISTQIITPEINQKDKGVPIDVINGALDILNQEDEEGVDNEPAKPTLH